MSNRTNVEWLSDLRSAGAAQEAALADLHSVILGGLPYALADWLSPDDPQFAALAEQVAQETLIRVLDRLDSFEGRSQFTTWAHKIAVRLALTELRRHKWRDVSLESLMEDDTPRAAAGLMADMAPGPEIAAERADLLARVQRVMREELTDKQRMAMMAIVIQGLPLEEAARQLGMERNGLYKLMHDARVRLKRKLHDEGLLPEEILAVFEQG